MTALAPAVAASRVPAPVLLSPLDAQLREAARREAQRSPTRRIIGEVCAAHGVTRRDLLGPGREMQIILARQEACYRLVAEGGLGFAETGRRLNRHHATVIHGARKHAERHGLPRAVGQRQFGRDSA